MGCFDTFDTAILQYCVMHTQERQRQTAEKKRAGLTNRQPPSSSNSPFTSTTCGRVCQSRIGLHSRSRRCSNLRGGSMISRDPRMPMRMRIAFSYGITKQIINADVIISIFVPFLRDNSISKRLYADINFFFQLQQSMVLKFVPLV